MKDTQDDTPHNRQCRAGSALKNEHEMHDEAEFSLVFLNNHRESQKLSGVHDRKTNQKDNR